MQNSPPTSKRVCFVSLEIFPTTHGGAGILLAQTASVLLHAGYEVVLLLNLPEQEFRRFRDVDRLSFPHPERLSAYRVADLARDAEEKPPTIKDAVWRLSVDVWVAIKRLIQNHPVDIIEFYDYCGPGWHCFADPDLIEQRLVVRLHTSIELIERRVRQEASVERAPHFHQERDQLRLADAIFYPGPAYFEEEACAIYPYLDRSRAFHSPPALAGFSPVTPTETPRDVLFYGRLSTLKGLDTFLRGIALAFDDSRFHDWVGDIIVAGPEETVASSLTLEEMVSVIPESLRGRLRFTGRINHADLKKLLPNVAFAVFANKIESFCYAAHELHLSGIPLILSKLPAFRDFFVDGISAVFFDDSARSLAEKLISLAGDPALRARLALAGVENSHRYIVNHYDRHLEQVKPRRIRAPASDLSVTVLIFSDGDTEAEQETLLSLDGLGAKSTVLRTSPAGGWLIAGTRFSGNGSRSRAEVDLDDVGEAVLGLRAGDKLVGTWFNDARVLMASDPRVGSIACWHAGVDGAQSSFDHLLPELALTGRMGLRRLIRVAPRQLFAELVAAMRNGGEAGLLLNARGQGLALLELARIGIDVREARPVPQFDIGAVMRTEYDRVDPRFLAMQSDTTRHFAQEPVVLPRATPWAAFSTLAAAIEPGLCVIHSRPDLNEGELWIMRPYAGPARLRMSWNEIAFTGIWNPHGDDMIDAYGSHRGSLSFAAGPDATIDLLRGPTCGICEILYGGAKAIIDLRQSQFEDLTIRLGDLSILRPRSPSIAVDPNVALAAELERALSHVSASGNLVLTRRDSWLATRAVLGNHSVFDRAAVHSFSSGGLAVAACLASWLRNGRLSNLAIEITTDDDLDLFDALVGSGGGTHVAAVLVPDVTSVRGQSGYAGSMLAAAALRAILRRRAVPATVFAHDQTLLPPFSAIGIRVASLHTSPQLSQLKNSTGGVPTLAIVGTSYLTQVRTHLTAAAMMVRHALGERVRILMPEVERQGDAVMREFNARPTAHFRALSELAGSARGPSVALCVYPDRVLPVDADAVAALGFLPLVGPAGLWGGSTGPASRFTVPYWEDALAIAEAATALIEEWPDACADYREIEDAARSTATNAATKLWDASPAARLLHREVA